jgi:predicted DNA-binding transcriptional regulator YafY
LWRRLRTELEAPPAAVDVTLRVRATRTAMLLRVSAAQLASPPGEPVDDGGGWDRLELPFRAVAAARGVLLGLGTDVEVVAPPELRAEMAETALAVARLYGRRKRASRKQ